MIKIKTASSPAGTWTPIKCST